MLGPPGEGTVDDVAPCVHEAVPREDDAVPRVGNVAAREDDAEPREDDLALHEDSAALREGDATPREDNVAPRDDDAALDMDDAALRAGDAALRVCLERELELGAVRLHVLDWPGRAGPLVYVPDPFAATEPAGLAAWLAAGLAPRSRVLAIMPRPDCPYLVQVDDLRRALEQFGFPSPAVLVSSGLGAALVLPLAAWYPALVRAVVLVDPHEQPPPSATLAARALRDCPPDWPRLKAALTCPLLVVQGSDPNLVTAIRALLKESLRQKASPPKQTSLRMKTSRPH